MVSENISILPSNVGDEDIVRALWRHKDAGEAAGKVLRTLLNITEQVSLQNVYLPLSERWQKLQKKQV